VDGDRRKFQVALFEQVRHCNPDAGLVHEELDLGSGNAMPRWVVLVSVEGLAPHQGGHRVGHVGVRCPQRIALQVAKV
jgi:hypothetical protein